GEKIGYITQVAHIDTQTGKQPRKAHDQQQKTHQPERQQQQTQRQPLTHGQHKYQQDQKSNQKMKSTGQTGNPRQHIQRKNRLLHIVGIVQNQARRTSENLGKKTVHDNAAEQKRGEIFIHTAGLRPPRLKNNAKHKGIN